MKLTTTKPTGRHIKVKAVDGGTVLYAPVKRRLSELEPELKRRLPGIEPTAWDWAVSLYDSDGDVVGYISINTQP
jgi:hypothetical protein